MDYIIFTFLVFTFLLFDFSVAVFWGRRRWGAISVLLLTRADGARCLCCVICLSGALLRWCFVFYHRLLLRNWQRELMETCVWPWTNCSIWVSLCLSSNLMTLNNAFKAVQRMKIYHPLRLLISMSRINLCLVSWILILCFSIHPSVLAMLFSFG